MCGIYGIFFEENRYPGREILQSSVENAMEQLRYRGPDGKGIAHFLGEGAFGHVRLSILDVSDIASQPMFEGTRFVIVYNGEIYNSPDLRSVLEQAGYCFKSTGDTEVVLKSCIEWGVEEACRRFNGMFSFALYDTQEKVLTLARDRLGIKPLFYSAKNGTVTFASELKCFGKPEPTAASVFAMLLGVPTLCPETPWKGVQEVEPGHCITFRIGGSATVVATSRAWISLGEMISERYYSELNRLKPHDYNELFHNTFLASLHRTMLSDVGIGIGVSGGIDSSLIVAGSASIGRRIPLFHAEVTGLESEITHAQSISEQFSCQFYATPVDPDSYRAYLPELTWVNDFPLGYHNNSVPFALMARDASKHVKVLLTGEGADELNGGYDWPANAIQNKRTVACLRRFTAILKRLHLNGLEKLIRHFSLDLVSNNNTLAEFQTLLGGFHEALWECKGKEAYAFVGNEWERQTQARYFATSMGHLQSLLWRNDRMGMFASIESRFPFLDNELLALQLNTPMRFKRCRGNNKMAIRASASRCGVNSQLANRPKYGFTVNPSSHCSVDRSFFKDGFLVDFLPEIISAGQPKDWDTFYFYQVAVEVWGRIFCLGQPLSLVQATLCSASEKLSSERQGE